jgi:hypothetical protein
MGPPLGPAHSTGPMDPLPLPGERYEHPDCWAPDLDGNVQVDEAAARWVSRCVLVSHSGDRYGYTSMATLAARAIASYCTTGVPAV